MEHTWQVNSAGLERKLGMLQKLIWISALALKIWQNNTTWDSMFFYHGTVIWDLMFTTFQTSCPVRSLDSKKYLLKRDSDDIRILDKAFPDYLIHLQNYTQCFFSPTYFPPEIIFLNFVFAYFCHSLGYNLCKSILFWFFLLIYPQCLEQCPNCEESLHKYLLIL